MLAPLNKACKNLKGQFNQQWQFMHCLPIVIMRLILLHVGNAWVEYCSLVQYIFKLTLLAWKLLLFLPSIPPPSLLFPWLYGPQVIFYIWFRILYFVHILNKFKVNVVTVIVQMLRWGTLVSVVIIFFLSVTDVSQIPVSN